MHNNNNRDPAVAQEREDAALADDDDVFLPRCATFNICGTTLEAIQQLLAANPPPVVCLQEIFVLHDDTAHFLANLGWLFFSQPRGEHGGGVGILVHTASYEAVRVPQAALPPDALRDGSEVIVVDIIDPTTRRLCRVASVYWPPRCGVHVGTCLNALSAAGVTVIGGDFNSRHARYCARPAGRSPAAARGRQLIDWLADSGWLASWEGLGRPLATTTAGTTVDFFLLHPNFRPQCHSVVDVGRIACRHMLVILQGAEHRAGRGPRRRERPILWHRVTAAHLAHARLLLQHHDGTPVAFQRCLVRAVDALPRGPWQPAHQRVASPFDLAGSSPNEAWKLLHNLTPRQHFTGALRRGDEILETPAAQAEAFVELFVASHEPPEQDDFPADPPAFDAAAVEEVHPWEVERALHRLRLKVNGALDSDGIGAKFLLALGSAIIPHLAQILTAVFRGADIPTSWLSATWIPILKAGKPPDLLSSYRCVAITSIISRLAEDVLIARMMAVVRPNMDPQQFGYLPGRSTSDLVANIVGPILDGFDIQEPFMSIDRGSATWCRSRAPDGVVVAADLTDGFPRTAHGDIIRCMIDLHAPAYIINFVWRWLRPRRARVFHRGRRSRWLPVLCGVPQGSKFGPQLFNIVMNSLYVSIRREWPLRWPPDRFRYAHGIHKVVVRFGAYADDASASFRSTHMPYIAAAVRIYGGIFTEWAHAHNMRVSLKTKAIFLCNSTSRNNAYADTVLQFGDLNLPLEKEIDLVGSRIDTNLHFLHHATSLVEKAETFEAPLTVLATRFSPSVCLSIAQTAMAGLAVGCEFAMKRLPKAAWLKLEAIFSRLVKRSCRMVATCSNADALLATGLPPLAAIIATRLAKIATLRAADARYPSPLSFCRAVAEIGAVPPVCQIAEPLLPPPACAANIVVDVPAWDDRPGNLTPADKRARNTARRDACRREYADRPLIEIWTDASCQGPHAAGAAHFFYWETGVVPDPAQPPLHVFRCRLPDGSCSFFAEGVTIQQSLAEAEPACLPDESPAVVLYTDSLSTLDMIVRRKVERHALAQPIIASALALAAAAHVVRFVHHYAHCDDPWGDPIDEAARAACAAIPAARGDDPATADLRAPCCSAWHVDVARHLAAPAIEGAIAALDDKASHFFRALRTARNPAHITRFSMPSGTFSSFEARLLLQLRTGRCPYLPTSTFLQGVPPTLCPVCGVEPLVAHHGAGLCHIFACPAVPGGPTLAMLASNVPNDLRAVLAHVRRFFRADFVHIEDDSGDEDAPRVLDPPLDPRGRPAEDALAPPHRRRRIPDVQ